MKGRRSLTATPLRRAPAAERPLWRCPKCGKRFASRNIFHSCARVPVARHFAGKPRARALFDAFRKAVETFGPVTVVSNRSGIGFMVRVRFAGVVGVRTESLRCKVWLTRRARSRKWTRVEPLNRRDVIYYFELHGPGDLDAEMRGYLREAYDIGCQRHLAAKTPRAPRRSAARARS
jgi:hypothetical protein